MFPNDDIFIDQAKPKAKKWREENDRKLIECHLVILIITPAALQSDEVKREIEIANKLKKLILPCKMNVLNLEWEELKLDLGSLDGIPFKDDEDLRTSLFGEVSKIRNEYYMLENTSGLSFEPITVNVDKSEYSDGDTIIISGQVKELFSNTPVSLRVVSPSGQFVYFDQLEINSDKKYYTEFTVGGSLMSNEGTYVVTAIYGSQSRTANVTFNFKGSSGISKSTTSENQITVEGSDFPITYSIKGGKINSVVNDSGVSSLIVHIVPTEDGEITLTIPRSLLDARSDDKDDVFFVLVDGFETNFDELKTDTERTLTVAFSENSKEIEIIGLSSFGKKISTVFSQPETPHKENTVHIISISASFDRTVYPLNSKIYVRVNCPDIIFGKSINLEILDIDNKLIDSKQIDPIAHPDSELKRAGIYQEFFEMNHNDWKAGKVYTVRASHGDATAYDSCTLDERTPVIQTDKSVYLWGTDMILTVIDPDADKDSQNPESVGNTEESFLTISSSVGKIDGYKLRETGDSTGIFQGIVGLIGTFNDGTVVPYVHNNQSISKTQGTGIDDGFLQVKQNDEIKITYKRKSDTVTLSAHSSNFGAMIELDQKVYTWTDKVRIAIVAPSFIKDPNKIEMIGNDPEGTISIKTRMGRLENYELVETGLGTGIFAGEIMLTGFQYDKIPSDIVNNFGKTFGNGPKGGILSCDSDDGLSVEFATKTETIVGSALIRWNIGEIQWMEPTYSLGNTGAIRVIDPDANLHPNLVDIIKIRVWSDSDPVGTEIFVVETGPENGIFVGDIIFDTKTEEGISLKVSPGDSVTAEYVDFTLPHPYKKGDYLKIIATTQIQT